MAPEMLYRIGHSRMVDWYLLGVLLYELLVGVTPYYSNNKHQLFQNIKTGPLLLPAMLSTDCKDLIKRLLCRNPAKRLGVNNDGQEIREHVWFKDIDWLKIYHKQYPVLPITYIQDNGLKDLAPDNKLFHHNNDKHTKDKIRDWTFIQNV